MRQPRADELSLPACPLIFDDTRILHQLALFSLLSSPSARIDEWLEENPRRSRRLAIV
jgi:hypothetical protein